MHVRAGLDKTARVLVPSRPEFRWMNEGGKSPWFPGFHRTADRGGDRRDVLSSLRYDLSN